MKEAVKDAIPIMLLLLGQLFTILAIYISHRKNKDLFQHQEQFRKQTERLSEQVCHFYGPLVLMTARSDSFFQRLQMAIHTEQWSESISIAKDCLVPLNDQILFILTEKIHLVDKSDRLTIYTHYAAHIDSFKQAVKESTDYLLKPRVSYPMGFKTHVETMYEQLRRAHIQKVEAPA